MTCLALLMLSMPCAEAGTGEPGTPIGTYAYVSVAGEKRIATYWMDGETGKLTHKGDAKIEGEPGALAVDPRRRFLFAALRAEGKLASFRIDPATGLLKHLGTVPAGPDPAHISTDAAGRFLLA